MILEPIRYALAMAAGRTVRDVRAQVEGPRVMTLRRGMRGQEVRRLQQHVGAPDDGVYGRGTEAAVLAYQAAHGVIVDPPGVAGPGTQRAMRSEIVLGVDVSRWQGAVDWRALRQSGVGWAVLKASQRGTAERFRANRDLADLAGIPTGAYHFAVTSECPAWNAAQLMTACRLHYDHALPPVLDLEDREMRDPPRLLAWTRATLQEIADRTGRRPWLYTSWSLMRGHLAGTADPDRWPAAFRSLPDLADLWVVRYNGADDPGELGPWGEWTAWQWSNDGARKLRIEGVESKGLDVNWIAGGTLRRLASERR